MKVIMQSNGAIKDVADGYARNYLFPKKLAQPATANALTVAQQRRTEFDEQQAKIRQEQQALADKLRVTRLTLAVKANDQGTLFAALDNQAIAAAIQTQFAVTIDPGLITVETIKKVGEYSCTIKLFEGSPVQLNLEVKAA